VSFEFAKITCGKEIGAKTGFNTYCVGKPLTEILQIPYQQLITDLNAQTDEERFVLYLEWDALRSSAAQYLGTDSDEFDRDRCKITSIEHDDEGIEVAQVILPPREMPKILPCSLADQ